MCSGCWLQKWIVGLCFASVAPLVSFYNCPGVQLYSVLPLSLPRRSLTVLAVSGPLCPLAQKTRLLALLIWTALDFVLSRRIFQIRRKENPKKKSPLYDWSYPRHLGRHQPSPPLILSGLGTYLPLCPVYGPRSLCPAPACSAVRRQARSNSVPARVGSPSLE